jgi:DNA (cytosine-5)-methyltransferase 1
MVSRNLSIKHLDLFSGIGGFRQAFELLSKDRGFEYRNVGFSEIDQYAIKTYKANFQSESEIGIGDIRKFLSSSTAIAGLPKFNLLTAGFPCQSFSIMGNKSGLADSRGNLAFSISTLLRKLVNTKPRLLLLENVRNLKRHDGEKSFDRIVRRLRRLGYFVQSDIFDTSHYGLPQKRRRIFILAELEEQRLIQGFEESSVRAHFDEIRRKTNSLILSEDVIPLLERKVPDKYFLSERIKPTILSNGTGGFESRSEINQLIARPLTATMMKMHRACQDNYYSEEFLSATNPRKYAERVFSKTELANHRIRRLTPKEAFRLQGFKDGFVENAQKAGSSDTQLYKQAGNAISVNVAYAILSWALYR